MTRWEYCVRGLVRGFEGQLNELGAEGWELMFCEFVDDGKDGVMNIVMKRLLKPKGLPPAPPEEGG